jgi:hypothetical protein
MVIRIIVGTYRYLCFHKCKDLWDGYSNYCWDLSLLMFPQMQGLMGFLGQLGESEKSHISLNQTPEPQGYMTQIC